VVDSSIFFFRKGRSGRHGFADLLSQSVIGLTFLLYSLPRQGGVRWQHCRTEGLMRTCLEHPTNSRIRGGIIKLGFWLYDDSAVVNENYLLSQFEADAPICRWR